MPLDTDMRCNRSQTRLPAALFEGSVRTLNPNIEGRNFRNLVALCGGEILGDY